MRTLVLALTVLAVGGGAAGFLAAQSKRGEKGYRTSPVGYSDTPVLPGQKWKVHDIDRPRPRMVTPAAVIGQPPSDAIVLFDGKDLSQWENWKGKTATPAAWKVENGYMEIVPGTGALQTKEKFGDVQLHLEWSAPVTPSGDSQWRANSGVLLMNRYEIQVLDCWENPTYADGQAASIYGQYPPLVNACRKPGEWQTYDIIWLAPRFEGEKLVRPAIVTVLHNGVVVHHATELMGATQHRILPSYTPHPPVGPLRLQDHGDLVRYRNIWYRPLKGYDEG